MDIYYYKFRLNIGIFSTISYASYKFLDKKCIFQTQMYEYFHVFSDFDKIFLEKTDLSNISPA